MSCTYSSAISLNCKDFIGGVKKVWLGQLSDFTSGVTVTSHEVTALPGTAGSINIYGIDVKPESSSFNQAPQVDTANNTIFLEQTLTVKIPGMSTAAGNATVMDTIDKMIRARNVIFVQDNNDQIYMMGRLFGAEVTAGNVGVAQNFGDFNGYELTFTAKEKFMAEILDQYTTDAFDNFAGITAN
jgi:hypothetical protein